MKIKKLLINGYGRFNDRELIVKDGLNLIYGENEAGKSTLQSFIKAMLFDFPRKNVDGQGRLPDSKKYKPWTGREFGGILDIETDDGRTLKINRDFASKKATVYDKELRDVTAEFPYSKKNGLAVGEALLNMDRECFENTAFIKQGGTIVLQDERKNLFEKLMNLSQTGSENTSAASANEALATASTALGSNRTKKRPYNLAMTEFSRIDREYSDAVHKRHEMESYAVRQVTLEKEINALKSDLAKYETHAKRVELDVQLKNLYKIKNKYDSYTDDLEKLSKDIFTTGQDIDINRLPENVTESGIVENIKRAASSMGKQNSITEEDPAKILAGLDIFTKRKKIMLAVFYAGITLSTLAAILFSSFLYVLTGLFTIAVVFLHLRSNSTSRDDLLEQIKTKKECEQNLIMINAFLTSAVTTEAEDFVKADIMLNDLLDKKKNSIVLANRLKRQQERKSDIEKFRRDVLGSYESISEIEALIDDLNKKIHAHDDSDQIIIVNPESELSSKQHELSGVRAILNEYTQSDEQIALLEEEREFFREKLQLIQQEQQAMAIASEAITLSAEGLQKEIIPKLNDKTSFILGQITDGRHSSLATGLDREINTEFQNSIHSLWEFSDGTIDQMYFSLRVAAADVFSEKESVPVIIDEAFAYYDESRIRSTFAYLAELAKDRQVIIFTCRKKEAELISEFSSSNIIEL